LLSREAYDKFRVAAVDPATIRCSDVEATLKKLAETSAGRIRVEKYAESFLGRPIFMAKIGSGPRSVLLWSQMHGDEPTHTAVLLDLLSYLARKPAEPLAEEILAGATLMMLPMLNPDGAEAVMRYNAQGIDINRDARRKSTPEARALRRAVETLKPDFGFNLHNQNTRTSVGTPPLPAAVSVLAPPPDRARTETPAMLRGKQLCTIFVEAVRPFAEGMISRYDDTFEPRAFGDTTQASGTATMLAEAGGWPDRDYEPLTRLHFHGLLATLHAIATDNYRTADKKIYESLPESNSDQPIDCIVRSATVLEGRAGGPFIADLSIDQPDRTRLDGSVVRAGRIVEVGDLERVRARQTIDAAKLLVLPGQILFLEDFSPGSTAQGDVLNLALAMGATTAIGAVDITDSASIDAIATVKKLPINFGFVGRIPNRAELSPSELVERVLAAVSRGVVAIVGDAFDGSVRQYCDWFRVPLLRPNQLAPPARPKSYSELAGRAWKMRESLKLPTARGRIGRDAVADLAFFEIAGATDVSAAPDLSRLVRVMVSGETVWENGKRSGNNPGVLLSGR
jgi:hypothetical protein